MLAKTLVQNRLAATRMLIQQNSAAMSTSVNIRAKFEEAYLERKANLAKGKKQT